MTDREFIREIAVLLFQQEKLSLGKASQLAAMTKWEFQSLLASRRISLHYDVAELQADIETLKQMSR